MPGRLMRVLMAILDLSLGSLLDSLAQVVIDFSEHF